MPRRSTDNDGADGSSAEAGEEVERSSASAISPPPPAAASLDAAVTTTSLGTAAAPSTAGAELHPSPDDAPVPLAQAFAAYDEAEMDSKKGVEVIESSGGDVPVPVAMMDISHDLDAAEKGAAGAKMAGKGLELVDDDDVGPAPPGHTANDDSDSKIAAKKMKAARVRGDAPGIAAGGDSVREPVFEEDHAQNLVTKSAPRGGRFPSRDAGGSNARSRQREVPRPSPAESTVPVFHEVHARLVEDEPDQPVYDAVPVGEEHWAKRHQKKIGGGLVLVIVALIVALGVAFGTGGGNDAAVALSPSGQPSMYEHPCFVDRRELKVAVNSYIAGGDACRGEGSKCEVTQKYGWPIGSWCTSNVTDMSGLFEEKETFDDDLSSWDTSSVTSMEFMFLEATSFNGDISNFDTSSVTSMESMFEGATSFNGDVSNFDTSQVTTMWDMFWKASSFNQDLSGWDVASVTDMRFMFEEASSFNGDVSNFDTSSVTTMEGMFKDASSFNGDVSNFDTSSVTTMAGMFADASSFNGDVSNFDTSQVTTMWDMFWNASSFNQDLSGWDVASVTDMRFMFEGASSFNGDVSNFNTSSVTSMEGMFWKASSFNQDVSNFDTSSVTTMTGMFADASSFNGDVSNFDTSQITDMSSMFFEASSFNQDLCAWGAHYKATGVGYDGMFSGTSCPNQGDPQGPNTNWCAATCQ